MAELEDDAGRAGEVRVSLPVCRFSRSDVGSGLVVEEAPKVKLSDGRDEAMLFRLMTICTLPQLSCLQRAVDGKPYVDVM